MSYFDQAYADLPAEWLNEPDAGYVSCLFARCKVINCFFFYPCIFTRTLNLRAVLVRQWMVSAAVQSGTDSQRIHGSGLSLVLANAAITIYYAAIARSVVFVHRCFCCSIARLYRCAQQRKLDSKFLSWSL